MAHRGGRPSIESVATAAGVSPTTVSHALSGKRAVSESTRQRIMTAIEEQNYRPNMVARGLRSKRTLSVALLLVDIANPYYPAVARAVHDVLAEEGYVSFIGNTDGQALVERQLLEEMVARGVDGVVMQPMGLSSAEVREVVGPLMPLVVTTTDPGEVPADSVLTNDALGLDEALAHLMANGKHSFGYIAGPSDAAAGPLRADVFRQVLTAAGATIRDRWTETAPLTRSGGAQAATRLLGRVDRPSAILCANDLIAMGATEAARAAGLRVPEDVAVVGFDDIDMADLVTPRLTTVVNPAAEVGDACARTILWRVANGPAAPFRRIVLKTRLVVRESA